jgi:hypothetical protein
MQQRSHRVLKFNAVQTDRRFFGQLRFTFYFSWHGFAFSPKEFLVVFSSQGNQAAYAACSLNSLADTLIAFPLSV